VERLQADLTAKTEEATATRSDITDLRAEVERLHADLAVKTEDAAAASSDVADVRADVERLQVALTAKTEEVTATRSEVSSLTSKVNNSSKPAVIMFHTLFASFNFLFILWPSSIYKGPNIF
jgi:chromosome segregation ATPase